MSYLKPIAYLPHRPPLVLIDEVIAISDEGASSKVNLNSQVLKPFLSKDGTLPSWYGIELMAQTVGIWAGELKNCLGRKPPKIGFILSCRAFKVHKDCFPPQGSLLTEVKLLMQDGSFASFDGTIFHQDNIVATGRLSLFQANDEHLDEIFN